MTNLRTTRLLTFARRLQRAATFPELITAALEEVRAATDYKHAWLMVAETEDAEELRLLEFSGDQSEIVWEVAPILQVSEDPFLREIVDGDHPVVVVDARSDPRTNKQIVEKLQNRTMVNIPMRLLDKPFGLFGVGTFGDEGCRAPEEHELDYLIAMASQLSVASGRIRYLEQKSIADKERQAYERRLLQAQKLESLGMLAGGVAHDFNNLLTVIMANASLAEERATDPLLKGEIESVLSAADRASALTRRLLAMSRSQELTLKPLDMNVQVRALVQLARRVFPETIEVDVIEARALPLVEGDAAQLDQVFMNLLINARDAMPAGGRLTLETEQVLVNGKYSETHPWAKPGRYVLITITDTGSGMPADVLERIFEPFFTTKGPKAGTGLGLAVTYGIVRQHRGMIQCYSEVSVGTTFKVYLPALERAATSVGTKLQPAIARGHERILVVEDNDLVREVVVKLLSRAGYVVTAVEDGNVACAIVAQSEFDLVLLDVVTPGPPCGAVVERIWSFHPSMRILLSSGYTAGTSVGELIQRTGLRLLRKPYDPDQLLRSVRQALEEGAEGSGQQSPG